MSNPVPNLISNAELYAMIDYFGDVGTSNADKLAELHAALGLQIRYEHEANTAEVTSDYPDERLDE